MNYSIKLFGLALIIVSAWLLGMGYSSYCKKRLAETKGFVNLLSYIEKSVALFLSTQREILSGYEDEDIAAFTDGVKGGKSFYDSFVHVRGRLTLSPEAKDKLSDFFSEFGKSYRDGEIKRTEMFKNELAEILNREEEQTPKRVKLTYTLLFAVALSVVIILL